MSLLVFLIVGAIAGWLAGLIVRGFGFGNSFLCCTKTISSRRSADQQASELNAGARKASPVRKLKQA